ncbi:MAG: hypothetical protein AB2421_05310 [Thermotaleaceae bacterium]
MKISKEIVWAWLSGIYLVGAAILLKYLGDRAGRTYNPWPSWLAVSLLPFLFGVLLRFPHLLGRWDKHRSFNWVKFLKEGLPACLGILWICILFYGFPVSSQLRMILYKNYHDILLYIAPTWLGMVLTDCIKGMKKTK